MVEAEASANGSVASDSTQSQRSSTNGKTSKKAKGSKRGSENGAAAAVVDQESAPDSPALAARKLGTEAYKAGQYAAAFKVSVPWQHAVRRSHQLSWNKWKLPCTSLATSLLCLNVLPKWGTIRGNCPAVLYISNVSILTCFHLAALHRFFGARPQRCGRARQPLRHSAHAQTVRDHQKRCRDDPRA